MYFRTLTYVLYTVTMFVLGIIAIEVWATQMPVWAFILALLICMPPIVLLSLLTVD